MGFNTTVVVYNDALDAIEGDSEFGKNLVQAIRSVDDPNSTSMGRSAAAGNHANVAMAIETHHADQMMIVAVGGNLGQTVGYGGSWQQDFRDPEARVKLIRALAEDHGYTLRKKPPPFDPEPLASAVIEEDERAADEE